MTEYRAKRDATFHLAWAGLIVAFLVGSAVSTSKPPLAVVFGIFGISCAIAWAWLSGWRLQSPVSRLPEETKPTPEEVRQRESARMVRDRLILLLHSSARPAVGKLREIAESVVADLIKKPDPYFTLGKLASLSMLAGFREDEGKIRSSLEPMWNIQEKDEHFKQVVADLDLERRTAVSYGTDFFFYFSSYRMRIPLAHDLAGLVGIDTAQDAQFAAWRRLDDRYVEKLREIVALPELAPQREFYEERMASLPS